MNCISVELNSELSEASVSKINDMVASMSTRTVVTTEASEGVEEVTRPITGSDVTDEDISELACRQFCNWVDKNEASKAVKPASFSDAI